MYTYSSHKESAIEIFSNLKAKYSATGLMKEEEIGDLKLGPAVLLKSALSNELIKKSPSSEEKKT